jgi:glycosyltransferase involved in cell wall biosynthesis
MAADGLAVEQPSRMVDLIDAVLRTRYVQHAGLNWRGRLIERLLASGRLPSRWLATLHALVTKITGPILDLIDASLDLIDASLNTRYVRSAGLNWKGRLLERVFATRRLPARLWAPLDSLLGLPSLRYSSLNWKGRAAERIHAFPKAAFKVVFGAMNEICFRVYWLVGRLKPRTQVRSVLQLSIASSKPYMISRVLRQQGLKSDYLAVNMHVASGTLKIGHDYSLPDSASPIKKRLIEAFYLWFVLARYDVIHSHFKTFLSNDGWEFDYLKRLGKGTIFTFRGCDLRSRTLNMFLHPQLNCCQECEYPVGSCDTDYQREQIDLVRRYADRVFVTTPDLVDFYKGSAHMTFIQPSFIDLEKIQPTPKPEGVFRVVTSSNHHGIDGTRFIVDAVTRLQAEGRAIELVIVSNKPLREALSIYKSADVYAGKLRLGYYNNANIETMMLGVPNMSFIREQYKHIAPDCPIIPATPDTIYDQLKKYIDRPDELRAIGALGPKFVERHHSSALIAHRLIEQYNEVFLSHRSSSGHVTAERSA